MIRFFSARKLKLRLQVECWPAAVGTFVDLLPAGMYGQYPGSLCRSMVSVTVVNLYQKRKSHRAGTLSFYHGSLAPRTGLTHVRFSDTLCCNEETAC